MKKVASLRYGVVFKKAFCNVEVFKAFVKDILGIEINIDKVETEKSFDPPIGKVNTRFDLFAEDKEQRIIVDIQHEYLADHYDRFMHYHCAAILEQVASAKDYQPEQAVYTIVVLTSGSQKKSAIATVEFDPKDLLTGKLLGMIPHKIVYLCPKYTSEEVPQPYYEWLQAIQDSLDEQVDEVCYHHPAILKVFELIVKESLTPEERSRMKDEYAYGEYYRKEKEEAEKRGIAKGQAKIAQMLLAEGMSVAFIVKVTGLSIEEIQQLQLNLNRDKGI
jgi:hypothetical protein